MPAKDGTLTPQERQFAASYARTGDVAYSAEKAGYAHPERRGYANLQKVGVCAEIQAQMRARLHNVCVPAAIDELYRQTTSEDLAPRDRRDAAWKLIQAAKADSPSDEAAIERLSLQETLAKIAMLEAQSVREGAETLEPVQHDVMS